MKLSIKYFLLICTMCLSTIDVCAQNAGKAIIKSPKIPNIKPPRVKPPINWAAPVVHEVIKANETSSTASTITSKNTKLPDVRLTNLKRRIPKRNSKKI